MLIQMSISSVSEAEACRYLGRRVTLIVSGGTSVAVGRLDHVSSRSAFVFADAVEAGPRVRAVRLASLERIEPVDRGGVTR